MCRKWDIQWCKNFWLSVGFHLDHTDPSLTFHLPLIIISFGRLKQPGFTRKIKLKTEKQHKADELRAKSHV